MSEIDKPNVSDSYNSNNSKYCNFLNYPATVQFPQSAISTYTVRGSDED